MADEEAQIQEDQSFWASGVPSEAEPWTSFGDPVEWPAGDDSVTPLVEDDLAAFPGDPQPEQAVSQSPGDELWLSGLDLGELAEAPSAGHETDLVVDLPLDPLPDSLWAPEPLGADPVGPDTVISGPVVPEPVVADGPMLVTSTLPAPQRVPASSPTSAASTSSLPPPPPSPSVYAEAEPDAEGGARWRRFLDLRNGNAGIVALVVLASLVLVGMFLSARARNDVSTANTPARPSGEIAARRPLNTVPLSTSTTTANSTTTTTTSPPGVSLSDLLLPGGVGAGDAAPGAGAGAGAGAGGAAAAGASGAGAGAGPRISTPATTAAPSRQAAPSGGGGGGGGAATQPPAEPPPTTRAPTVTSPPDTSPVDTTQPPTTRRTPPRDLPTVTFTVPTTEPTTDTTLFTRPSIPRPSIPDVDGD